MPQFITLAFCSTFVLCGTFSSVSVAQSIAPITQAPVLPETSLSESIQQTIASQMAEMEMMRGELVVLQAMRENTSDELQAVESVAIKSGVSIESFPEIVKSLQAKRIELMIDVAGLDAKREAILVANQKQPNESAILVPLERIVAHNEDKLARIRKAKVSSAEIRSAELAVLESKVKLAEAKSRKPSYTLLSDALLNTSLALAESKARLAKTESLLNNVLPTRTQLESTKLLKERTDRLTADEYELSAKLRATERKIEWLDSQLRHSKKLQSTSKDLP